jgi:hypothetical protein
MFPGERASRTARPVVCVGSSSALRMWARVAPSRFASALSGSEQSRVGTGSRCGCTATGLVAEGSKRVQRGGFVSEEDAAEALERELERLRRERRAAKSLTLAELVEV